MKETKTPLEKAVLYVVLTVIAFIAIFPLLYIILASFRTNKEIFEYALPFTWKTLIPQNWTMNNYVAIFFRDGLWNSFEKYTDCSCYFGAFKHADLSSGRFYLCILLILKVKHFVCNLPDLIYGTRRCSSIATL